MSEKRCPACEHDTWDVEERSCCYCGYEPEFGDPTAYYWDAQWHELVDAAKGDGEGQGDE